MFDKIREKMVAEWHTIVAGAETEEHKVKAVADWLLTEIKGEFMTLFERIEALEAKPVVDTATFATQTELAAVSSTVAGIGTEVTTLQGLVGTPAVVTPPVA